MRSMIVATLFLFVLVSVFAEIDSKTYYFNKNKTTNEYQVFNRYSFEHPSSIVRLAELRNNASRPSTGMQTHPLLDPEWDYNWNNITREKLPAYIHHLFDSISERDNQKIGIRILFNKINSTLLKFNLTNVVPTPENGSSEIDLHFYFEVDKKFFQKPIILRLYQMDHNVNESSTIKPDSHKLLNVIYVLQADNGWQMFKLTNSLPNALKNGTDLKLFITISKPNNEDYTVFKDTKNGTFRTFLVWKTDSTQQTPISVGNEVVNTNSSCRKHDLYINFEKLNWMKFIIAPQGYNAANCYGRCYKTSNLPNFLKVASHHPEISRKAFCCVATAFRPLSIMFYDRNGNVGIKNYGDMIVSKCGCR